MKYAIAALAILCPASVFADHELYDRDLNGGAALYQDHCASCHGVQLEGQPDWQVPGEDGILPAPPHDATGHTWHHDNRLLFDYTKFGGKALFEARGITAAVSGMPGFVEVLSDQEIWDVLAYIRSTWPGRIKRIQATRNRPH